MAIIEIKRIKRAIAVESVETFEKFKDFMDAACNIVKADFMRFHYRLENYSQVIRFQIERDVRR